MVNKVKGVRYEPTDMFEVLEREKTETTPTVYYIDPPGYAGGYEKLFDTQAIEWPAPTFTLFKPKEGYQRLLEATAGIRNVALILKAGERLGADAPRVVWATPAGKRIKYIMTNRPEAVKRLMGHRPVIYYKPEKQVNPNYPVWGGKDDRVTADSVLKVQQTTREVGLYYRDLFAHGLGQTDSEMFLLLWLDGKVFGAAGLHLLQATQGKKFKDQTDDETYIWESYGFTARSTRYRHLNRLLMMSLTCEEFGKWIASIHHFPLGFPAGIRTACITKGHESKGNRGILKLLSREKRKDGRYHLVYQTHWREGTLADQVKLWHGKYAHE